MITSYLIYISNFFGFLGFPTWYEYLPKNPSDNNAPMIHGLSDIWLIVAAGIEILLRIAASGSCLWSIYGGVLFLTSQGEPAKVAKARNTLIYALAGLVIAVTATALVTFIAGRFTASSS